MSSLTCDEYVAAHSDLADKTIEGVDEIIQVLRDYGAEFISAEEAESIARGLADEIRIAAASLEELLVPDVLAEYRPERLVPTARTTADTMEIAADMFVGKATLADFEEKMELGINQLQSMSGRAFNALTVCDEGG